jgi:hypothetical protein
MNWNKLLLHISFIYIIIINFYYDVIRFKKSASTLSDTLLRTQTHPSEFANILSRSSASTFEETDTPRDWASVSTSDAKVSMASKPWSALHKLLDTLPLLNLLYSVLNP